MGFLLRHGSTSSSIYKIREHKGSSVNRAFRYYGSQLSVKMEKTALIVQAKYGLSDKQLAGLLQIKDFFERISMFRVHVDNLRIVESKNSSPQELPLKTALFFAKKEKCSDFIKYFNPHSSPEHFERFAETILKNIEKTSDYIAEGLLVVQKTVNISVEYTVQDDVQ
jgi:hypothetical protein